METSEEPICCPKFDPAPWDEKKFEWRDKVFVKGSVFTIFYMPMNFGGVMVKMDKKIREAGADWSEGICLSDHTSSWNMDLYISVDKRVTTMENKIMNGNFFSKVYEGPYKDVDKWCKDFEQVLAKNDLKSAKTYTWYTTCPKCAKKYGKNYVVMIAQLS